MKKQRNKTNMPWCSVFGKYNFMLTGVSVALICLGCMLMLPEEDVRNKVGGRYAAMPGPGTYDARRIRFAPIPLFAGYVIMIPAILYQVPQRRRSDSERSEKDEK